MANLKIHPLQADSTSPFNAHVSPTLGRHGGNFAEFDETNGNGDVLRIKGVGLVYDDGVLVDGTITAIALVDSQGLKYCTMSDFKLDAAGVPPYQVYWAFWLSYAVLDGGNDRVVGSSGADLLNGYFGRDIIKGLGGDDTIGGGRRADTLSGGAGADVFYFAVGDGRDRITDFTPGLDSIDLNGAWTLAKANGGRDTLVEFEGGSVLLEDNRRGELQMGDIY